MTLRLALLALPLALAACDAQSTADFRLPWDKPEPEPVVAEPGPPTIPEPTGASPAEQPLEIEGRSVRVATANAETLEVTDVTAAGEGWRVTVEGGKARYERTGAKPVGIPVRRIVYANGLEYVGTLNGGAFALNIGPADCGREPLTATLKTRGNALPGCATPGVVPPPAAPAAETPAPARSPAA